VWGFFLSELFVTYAKGFYKSNTWTALNILLIDRSARFSGSLGSSGFTIHFVSRFVTMSSSKKRKISSKTLKEKYEAIKKLESGCANKNVAADYDVSPSTLSTWLKSKDKIVKAFEGGTSSKTQKLKPCGNENLERALYTWFVQMRRQGVPVSGPVLREKALSYVKEMDIKDFIASNGWFDRWKSSHGVAFKAALRPQLP
jgi:ribosomal protein S18